MKIDLDLRPEWIKKRLAEANSASNPNRTETCNLCNGTEWLKTDKGMLRCECVRAKIACEKLADVRARFFHSSFENFIPRNHKQEKAKSAMLADPFGSFFLHGPCGSGKTHLLYSHFKSMTIAGVQCGIWKTHDLLKGLMAESTGDSLSAMDIYYFRRDMEESANYHMLWDDADKFKVTDFKLEALYDIIDTIYERKLGLSLTSNFPLITRDNQDLQEKLSPAIVRRIRDMCTVLEL